MDKYCCIYVFVANFYVSKDKYFSSFTETEKYTNCFSLGHKVNAFQKTARHSVKPRYKDTLLHTKTDNGNNSTN